MSEYLSQKLRTLSFILIIMVVFLHGYNANIAPEQHSNDPLFNWIRNFQLFLSDGVLRVAVPLFFATSGFLQVGAFETGLNVENYLQLLKKRFFSLFVPFVIASTGFLVLFSFFSQFPATAMLFGKDYSILPFEALFHKIINTPVPFQFWFIRFLIQYIIVLPLIFVAIRLAGAFYILLLYLIWFNFEFQAMVPTYDLGIESFFFFSLGVYFGMHKALLNNFKPSVMQIGIVGISWLAILMLRFQYYNYPVLRDQLLVVATSAGVIFIWLIYDVLEQHQSIAKRLKAYSGYSFGIFIFHEPLLSLVKKLMIRLGGFEPWIYLFTYLLAPILSIVVSYFTIRMLQNTLPRAYKVITGGR